ncbi:MAG: exodeoxyribonuclease [Bacteroidales bacterium]|jgi:exodeoxyribonuclease-3|nr:exodeoxyribonuclease [Bacteroidales bacterium]NLH53523.1 exodeoxyribonuclease III [Bacteroidales bacterium]NPV35293.1 exodeoxyribonuclease III [Bacteroidales bacterium]
MKIITYNVNGIRSAINKGLTHWLSGEKPDILCIQETKAQPDQIPSEEFKNLGYSCFWHSAEKKGYSGVGLLALHQPDRVIEGMGIPEYDREGRFIRADFGDISVISVYHPSGTTGDVRQEFKMKWLEDFLNYVKELRKERSKLIISGDFNICHKPIDIHDPIGNSNSSGFLPEEREWLDRFIASGFVDTFRVFNQQPHQYTWWSFRANARSRNLGWRIDYHMVTENLKPKLRGATILPHVVHSDHCPAVVEIEF